MKSWEQLSAEDLMKSPVLGVDVDATLAEAARTMSENQVSGLLVTDHRGEAVGVVSHFDIVSVLAGLERPAEEPGGFYRSGPPKLIEGGEGWEESWEEVEGEPLRETLVGEIMSPEIITVGPRTPAPEVARILWERRIHRVFVEGRGGPAGVISSLDLLATLAALPLAKARG